MFHDGCAKRGIFLHQILNKNRLCLAHCALNRSFTVHNYCPTCREAGKGDDPCVTFETPCQICTSFTDEQLQKIQKQKAATSSKDDELDLLGEGDGDSSLDPMQTSSVLLITFSPHPPPTPPPPPPPPVLNLLPSAPCP